MSDVKTNSDVNNESKDIECYCQRLKSQALQQFRTEQKQSPMHHQSELSINQIDDHPTMTRLSIKNQSSNKSNMTNISNCMHYTWTTRKTVHAWYT